MKIRKIVIVAGIVAGIAACVGDFAVTFYFGRFYPGYNQLHDTMSTLGATASPVSGILSTWWVVMGLLFMLFAIAFYYSFAPRSFVNTASVFIFLYGLGEGLGSGIFKADPTGETLINSYLFHNILGGIGVVAILAFPLFIKGIMTDAETKWFSGFSYIIFSLGIIFIVLFLFRFESFGIITELKGLWQRLFVADVYIYLLIIDGLMIKKLCRKP
jgi:hypothetical protein